MKKLITLFSFVALFSLIFIGCQSNENITSPVDDLEKVKPIVWEYPAAVNVGAAGDLTKIMLIAGQHTEVGYVTVEQINSTQLEIMYYTEGSWSIIETHLAVASHPSLIPQNKSGNPQIGLFSLWWRKYKWN